LNGIAVLLRKFSQVTHHEMSIAFRQQNLALSQPRFKRQLVKNELVIISTVENRGDSVNDLGWGGQ
jgi:hypothetical protein